MRLFLAVIGAAALLATATQAQNLPPPADPIQDLAGQPLPDVWTEYTTSFIAAGSETAITFAFRNDPGWTVLDDVDVTTGGGPNLISNGSFQTGSLGPWTYANIYGAAYGGYVSSSCESDTTLTPLPGDSYDWCDGATQAYDAISQTIATTAGDTYDISYWLDQQDTEDVTESDFQDLSTNGGGGVKGNGIDTLVYAQAGLPAACTTTTVCVATVPEPMSLALFGSALVALGAARRRKPKSA